MINKRIIEIIIAILVAGNIYFAYNYFSVYSELQALKSAQVKVEVNEKVIDFSSMFIKKVLQADQEVDFETREAQNSVKKLLGMLVGKIQK